MIIQEELKDVQVSGAATQGFTILATSKAFQILSSNIYTNKIRAIIREISTNAYDAHVDAKNDNLFDVHLPTNFEPWFSVRDYGKGLSHEDMYGLYTQFFNSTRTKSDDFCGALGIGRMAPLSKIDSFTVQSFQGGFVRTYTIFKNEQGLPNIAHLGEEPTVEPSGLNVFVNVEKGDIEEYKNEAINVFKYFKKVPNINIKEVKMAIEDYHNSMRVNSETVRSTLRSGNVVAVMGNVAYNVPYEYHRRGIHAELHFPIGAISFDPGRENLSLDTKTIEAVKAACNSLSSNIANYLEKDIESRPTDFEKYVAAVSYAGNYDGQVRKRIESVVDKYAPKCDNHHVYMPGYRSTEHYIKKDVVFVNDSSEYYLHKDKMTARIKEYVKSTKKTVVVLTQEQINNAKIPAHLIKDLDTLPKVKRVQSSVKRGNIYTLSIPSYSHYVQRSEFSGVLPTEEKIYFVFDRSTDLCSIKNKMVAAIGLGIITNKTIVYGVNKKYTQRKAFAKENWVLFDDYVQNNSAKFKDLEIEDISNIDDVNQIRELARSYKIPLCVDLYKEYEKTANNDKANHLNLLEITYKKLTTLKEKWKNFYKKYPLIKYVYLHHSAKTDVIEYMAAMDKLFDKQP